MTFDDSEGFGVVISRDYFDFVEGILFSHGDCFHEDLGGRFVADEVGSEIQKTFQDVGTRDII